MKRYAKQTIAVVAILACSAAVSIVSNRTASADNCANIASSVVTGSILSNGEQGGGALALVQNASDCTYTLGMASYQGGSLFDSQSITIPAWQQEEIHVSVPNCAYEVDVFRGQVLNTPSYGSNLITNYNGHQSISCGAPATPTPTPTPVYNPTPTPAPVSNPTPTPTPVINPNPTPANQGPVGSYEARCDVIGGWAYDPDSSSQSITVSIYDGLPTAAPLLGTMVTTGLRQDLNTQAGITGNHGFTIVTPASLKDGNVHQIYVLGFDAQTGKGTFVSGPVSFNTASCAAPAPVNHAAIGALDFVQCDTMQGWSYDPDQPSVGTDVHFYMDGPVYMDGPAGQGTLLTDTYPNTNRPDVNNALGISGTHGFLINTPAALKDGNAHTVYAYAIDADPSHSLNSLMVGSPKTVQCVNPTPTPTPTIMCENGQLPAPTPGCHYEQTGVDSHSCPIETQVCTPTPNQITGTILVSPTTVCLGQTADLAWATSNASSVVISNIGQAALRSDVIVLPSQTTTYTLTATNSQGSTPFTASATVMVSGVCATPAPTATPIPQSIISNSFNNTTTNNNTINNTSTITQYGNGNNAQVNQNGAQQHSSTGDQSNIAVIYAPTPTPYYQPYQYYPTPYPTPYPVYYPTPTPTPVSALSIQKYGHNVSRGETANETSVAARPNDTIEFDIVVTDNTSTTLSNINVIDYLPAGLHYVAGSTALNGSAIADGVANSSGINVGYLYAGQHDTIRLFATVDAGAYNGQTYTNNSSTRADNYGTVNSNPVYVTVSNGAISGGLHVPTGPGDWGMGLALMGSLTASGAYLKRKGMISLIKLA